ncbi:MAG: putative Ig domain-containing protein, partial [Ruminiclostridium sp.]
PLQDILDNLVYDDYTDTEKYGQPVEIPDDAKVVWMSYYDEYGYQINDEYHLIDKTATVDMSIFDDGEVQFIVGDGTQLGMNNQLYNVSVTILPRYSTSVDITLAKQNESERALLSANMYYTHNSTTTIYDKDDNKVSVPYTGYSFSCEEKLEDSCSVFAGLTPHLYDGGTEISADSYDVTIYNSSRLSNAVDVTDAILNMNVDESDSGTELSQYGFIDDQGNWASSGEFGCGLVLVYSVNGADVYTQYIYIGIAKYDIEISGWLKTVSNIYIDYDWSNDLVKDGRAFKVLEYELDSGYAFDDEYIPDLDFNYTGGSSINITKIAEGVYDTLEEAQDQPDLNGRFDYYASDPYKAVFSEGVDFTLFADESTEEETKITPYYFTVRILDKYEAGYDFSYAQQNDVDRLALAVNKKKEYSETNGWIYYENGYSKYVSYKSFDFYVNGLNSDADIFAGIKPKFIRNGVEVPEDEYQLTVYDDIHLSTANDVTDEIINMNQKTTDSGYKFPGAYWLGSNGELIESKGREAKLVFVYSIDGYDVYTQVINIEVANTSLSISPRLYDDNGYSVVWSYDTTYGSGLNEKTVTIELADGYSVDDEYAFSVSAVYNSGDAANIKKIVQGNYDSYEAAESQPDISGAADESFKAVFKNGLTFTIFIEEGTEEETVITPYHLTVKVKPYVALKGIRDPYLTIYGLKNLNADGNEVKSFVVENGYYQALDDYYEYGYQTLFVDDPNLDMSQLLLKFDGNKADNVYDAQHANCVDLNQPQDFSNGTVQYTVSTGEKIRSYFITIKKKETGAKFYVNGPSERTVYFDDYNGTNHELLLANIGDAELTGLNVTLTDAENVKLDDYWVVGGTNNDTLPAFENAAGMRNNLAKIRLVQDGDGEVKGTLTITADGQEPVVIKLSGHAGNPKIVTDSQLPAAVKYVPYQVIVATDNIFDWNTVTYSLYRSTLPDGLTLNSKTGEITGVPTVNPGTYTFTVAAKFSGKPLFATLNPFETQYKEFTLEIKNNDEVTVFNSSDENYEIKTPIGTEENTNYYVLTEYNTDLDFISYGEWADFEKLWLNGKELIEGTDYVTKEGSTVITIKSQVFTKLSKNEQNTIAAEFRIGDDDAEVKELKRTAQNFVIKDKGGNSGGGNGNSGGGSNNGGGSNSGGNSSNNSGNTDKDDASGNENDTAVDNVIDLIDKLPDNVTVDDEKAVEDAREAYDKLTDEQKKHVTNYGDLLDAEKKLKEALENEDDEIEADDDAETEEGITLSGKILDKSGKALSNVEIEIHSVVQKTTADKNGNYKLESVEFGKHSITIKDSAGNSATKAFEISLGNKTSVGENVIVAADGASVKLDIEFDGNTIKFINSSTDEVEIEDDDSSYDYDNENPNTSTGHSLVAVAIAAGALACVSSVSVKRSRKKK